VFRRLKPGPRTRRILLGGLVTLLAAYLVFGAFIWHAMHQPPEHFARVMAKMPGPIVFLLFPFETMWVHARAGDLNVGDPAPDFSLVTADHTGQVQLSALNKQQPTVLIFGSYT
jgi:hypothetical protein